MQPTGESPSLDPIISLIRSSVDKLAPLYDKYVNSLDPYCPDSRRAGTTFESEIRDLYDSIKGFGIKVTFDDFRRKIVSECKEFLKRSDKKPGM